MHGSIRQRSTGSFELRVYIGTDPAAGQRCYRTKTARANRSEAERELAAMVETVGRGPGIAARTTVRVMLEDWFAVASNGWAPTTIPRPDRCSTPICIPMSETFPSPT